MRDLETETTFNKEIYFINLLSTELFDECYINMCSKILAIYKNQKGYYAWTSSLSRSQLRLFTGLFVFELLGFRIKLIQFKQPVK